jgi:FMN phosphatase YigB (HAD superfamily)
MDEFIEFYDKYDLDINLGKVSTEEYWKKCIERFKLENAEDYDLPKWWVADYKIIKPVNEMIFGLVGKIDMGIISNINSGIWEAAVKYEYVPNIEYKQILLSYKLGIKKPDRKIFEIAQEKSGVHPEEILFIDDQLKNLTVPEEMGWKTVLFDQSQSERGVDEIKNSLN